VPGWSRFRASAAAEAVKWITAIPLTVRWPVDTGIRRPDRPEAAPRAAGTEED